MKKVVKVKFNGNLKETILKGLEPLGGIQNFVKKGEVVLLKPNFNTADLLPAATDYEFLKAVVEIIYSAEPKLVMTGESSTMSFNTRKIMEKLNIFNLLNLETPPRIYVLEEYEWVKKDVTNAQYLKSVSLTEILERVDRIIFLPCLKTHKYAQYSGALKLAVGFMKPTERIGLHLSHIQEKIAELNSLFNVDLIIMDARKCFITKGPAEGEIRKPNLILVSNDRIAIDIEGIKIIQSFEGNSLKNINPWELPQIKRAIELNLGVKSEKDYEVIELE